MRSTSVIPAVPAAGSFTTIAFIVRLLPLRFAGSIASTQYPARPTAGRANSFAHLKGLSSGSQALDTSRPYLQRCGVETTCIEAGRAPVDGIDIYYEVHGRHDGTPLVLLHGGGSTIESNFGRVIPFLARTRRVVALEEQGHGRTSDRDAPYTFERSADDVAGLLRQLGIPQADLLGFSNGASVALQVAIRHPEMVRKLVFASSFTRRDGAQPQLWEFMKHADITNMPQPLKDAFLAVNPDPQKLKRMHDKDAARMAAFIDVPEAAVRSVRAPVLVVAGDRDVVRLEHALDLSRMFPDARLLVLPSGHGDYLAEASTAPADTDYAEITARLVERFLAGR